MTTPEDMKPGEIYRVVGDKEHGGIKLEKVQEKKAKLPLPTADLYDIEFQLSPIRFHMACIQAHKAGMTYDQWICHTIEEMLDQIYDDGPSKY